MPPKVSFVERVGELMADRVSKVSDQHADTPLQMRASAVIGKKNLKQSVPSSTTVERLVARRATMSWQDLAANTVELGMTHPMALLLVRDLEKRAEQSFAAADKVAKAKLAAKRARCTHFVWNGGNTVKGKKTLILDKNGRVHKKPFPHVPIPLLSLIHI